MSHQPEHKHRHRFIAAVYDSVLRPFERRIRPYRSSLVAEARGRILEIGAGTGANFLFYDQASDLQEPVIAAEPDPFMRRHAEAGAEQTMTRISMVDATAESLPFETDSFDTVIGTFVLCTVADPVWALAEVARVLRPDGRYLFFEHIRSERKWAVTIQDLATPLWSRFTGGCHLNRDTVATIREQFTLEQLEQPLVGSSLLPLVMGRASNRPRGDG